MIKDEEATFLAVTSAWMVRMADASIRSGETGSVDAIVTDALGKALHRIDPDDIDRFRRLAVILQEIGLVGQASDAEGTGADTAARGRPRALRRMREETAGYLGFSTSAEALHRAATFEEFLLRLPEVDLGRTYGHASGPIAPFPLIWAMDARDKALERVQAMLNAGARLDLTTKFYAYTVLHWIAQSNRKGRDKRLAILRLLVLKGADLEARDRHGRTPLHLAITQGSVDEVAILLEAGANPRSLLEETKFFGKDDRTGLTTLMLAADNPGKIRLLLDHGADPAQRGGDEWDLLSHLRKELAQAEPWLMERPKGKRAGSIHERLRDARAASLALVEPLVAARPTLARRLTYREAPELFHALQTEMPPDAWRDTLAKVEVSTYHAPNGDCPIYWPIRAKADRPQKLWLMLQAGASVQGDPGNGTALHILADQRSKDVAGQKVMVQMLVQSGAAIEARDYRGQTPLARAVSEGGPVEVAALLAAGASVGVKGVVGCSQPRWVPLLMVAADRPKIFRLLLDHGADLNPPCRSIAESIALEVTDLDAGLLGDLSGNCRRQMETSRRGYLASQAMLVAKAPHAF